RAIDIARRLTTGKVVVVDIYSPQWTPGQSLVRYRTRMAHPPSDPRISWQTGRIDLLPLPDKSVTAVILCQVLSEFWQEGDQLKLLDEIYRILAENGRLLVAESVRSRANSLYLGPQTLSLAPVEQWRSLLQKAGFRVRSEKDLQGIIHCFRADKPTYTEAQQLTLGLNL
ncbi:MAG: class I SAM-dependent methyltransferase, partial [Anaerolineae bacterium]